MAYVRPWEFKNEWTTKVNVQVKLPEMEQPRGPREGTPMETAEADTTMYAVSAQGKNSLSLPSGDKLVLNMRANINTGFFW